MVRTIATAVAVVVLPALALVAYIPSTWIDPPVVAAQPACAAMRNGKPVSGNQDALARLLASSTTCPRDVVALRAEIVKRGGKLETAFVNNRGFHNPAAGSYSLFEMVSGELMSIGNVADGEFFFGHFVDPNRQTPNTLSLTQTPGEDALMIEAVVWDPAKGLFNFYELIGTGATGRWDYNGDSADIISDTALLHRQRNAGTPPIGATLRCSHCHVNAGPILKEFAAPQNDWWTAARRLPLGGRQLDTRLNAIAPGFVDGARFAAAVRAGLTKLTSSNGFREAMTRRSLQEQLRPLFCAVELNLESDLVPLDDKRPVTQVPSGVLVDPRLARATLEASRLDYDAALQALGSRFPSDDPQIRRADADHAWLGPVKATSDQMGVQMLVDMKVIDEEFAADVLAIDFTNPVLSHERCSLLKLVPNEATADWRQRFEQALRQSSNAAAQTLAANLSAADRTAASHRQHAEQFLTACASRLKTRDFVGSAVMLLAQRREEIRRNEISANRRRQILEPGFRVIFPEPSQPPIPGALALSPSCDFVKRTGSSVLN